MSALKSRQFAQAMPDGRHVFWRVRRPREVHIVEHPRQLNVLPGWIVDREGVHTHDVI